VWKDEVTEIQERSSFLSLFSDLLAETADEKNNAISSCLLKAKLLASKLRSRKFRQWVSAELDGYGRSELPLPQYRIDTGPVYGNFHGAGGMGVRGVQLPTSHWPAKHRALAEEIRFTQGARELEELMQLDSKTLHRQWSPDLVSLYRRDPGVGVTHCQLQYAYNEFTLASVAGVLHAIRTRLIDFLIELGEKHPDLEQSDAAAATVSEDDVTSVVEHKIFNNCNFIAGDQDMSNVINADDISVGGDFVVADAITNSFNKVAESKASTDVKAVLKQLGDALMELGKKLPPDKAKEVAQDVDAMATEAAKPAPRKRWLETAAEGLKKTAKTVAQVGPSVIALLDSFIKLF
jgi:hypothetical protein